MATRAYTRLRPLLDTGDILLFSGRGAISAGIKQATKCRWSHVGMVLRSRDWNILFCWE